MWYRAVFLSGSIGTAGCVYYVQRQKPPNPTIIQQLEKIKTIGGAVKMLQSMAMDRETDDLKSELVDRVYTHGLSEVCVLRLSKLHRRWGTDLGLRGYAITFIWSAIHEAFSHDRWQFISDT